MTDGRYRRGAIIRSLAMRCLGFVVTSLLGSWAASSLAAQEPVAGVVFDSLRTGRPLAGVELTILGTTSRTISDSLGRFSFSSVPTGEFVVAAWSPWLDTLAIPFLHHRVAPGATGLSIKLSTPSPQSFQRDRCGTILLAEQGTLLGKTRTLDGTPVAGQVVWAEWSAFAASGRELRRELVATVDTSDAEGQFTLCGVPLHRSVHVRAVGSVIGSGEVAVHIGFIVQRQDITVGPVGEEFELRGRVVGGTARSTDGDSAVSGADIQLRDDPQVLTRTNSDGRFRLRLPRRTSALAVRAVGFTPIEVLLPTHLPPDSLWTIHLERRPQELAAVAIVADPYIRERQEFERRRQGGMGRFVTEEMLERVPWVTPNAIRSIVPSISVDGDPRSPRVRIRGSSGFGFCDPRIFEDGQDRGKMEDVHERRELVLLFERAKRLEIYSAALSPPKFNDNDGCGAIVIWTR